MTEIRQRHEGAGERREWILSTLRTDGFVPISDLARRLGVSHMTIRRDLHVLESTGAIRIFHGGAALAPHVLRGTAFEDDEESSARRRVAATAAAMVEPGDVIVIDAGPTGYALAQALGDDFAGCVITHSMPVLQLFDERGTAARAVALGGELLADRHAFVGPTAEAAVSELRARTFFFAPAAVDDRGMYAHSAAEGSLQSRLLDIADRVVLLATAETFTSSAPARVAYLDRLTAIVCDRRPPAEVAAAPGGVWVVTHIAKG